MPQLCSSSPQIIQIPRSSNWPQFVPLYGLLNTEVNKFPPKIIFFQYISVTAACFGDANNDYYYWLLGFIFLTFLDVFPSCSSLECCWLVHCCWLIFGLGHCKKCLGFWSGLGFCSGMRSQCRLLQVVHHTLLSHIQVAQPGSF